MLIGEEKKEEKCKLKPFKYCPKVVNIFVFTPFFCNLFFAKVAKVEPVVKCEHHHHH